MDIELDLSTIANGSTVGINTKAMRWKNDAPKLRAPDISHAAVATTITEALEQAVGPLQQITHTLTSDNRTYLGLATYEHPDEAIEPVLAWRFSHSRRIPTTLFVGFGIKALDTAVIPYEHSLGVLSQNFLARLPEVIADKAGSLKGTHRNFCKTTAEMRRRAMGDRAAMYAITELCRKEALVPSCIPYLIEDWYQPPHRIVGEKSAWRLLANTAQYYRGAGTRGSLAAMFERSPELYRHAQGWGAKRAIV